MELKPSHEMFVKELIKHNGNQTEAYMEVYPKAKYSSARHSASLLLTNVYIKQRIYELLEQNGLGLPEVIKKLSEFMYAKTYRIGSDGDRVPVGDNKILQHKGLTLALRLYEALIRSESIICVTAEERAQVVQMAKELEAFIQKTPNNSGGI